MLRPVKTFGEVFRKLYFLAIPYSRKKPLLVVFVTVVQGVLQVAGVTSIFPFLALASDPAGFRLSHFGGIALSSLPPLSDGRLLLMAGVFSVLMLVTSNAANLLSDYVRARYAHGLAHWLRVRLLSEIVSQPWSFFTENNTGVLLKKVTNDVMQATIEVLFPVLEAFARSVTVMFLAITLLWVDPVIAGCATIILMGYYGTVFSLLRVRYRRASDEQKHAYRGAMTEAQQLLAGIKPIKVQRAEGAFLRRYSSHSEVQARVNATLPIYFHAPKYILEPIAFGGMISVVVIQFSLGRDLTSIIPTIGVIGLAGYRILPAAQLLYAQISQIVTSRHTIDEVHDEFVRRNLIRRETAENTSFLQPHPLEWNTEIRMEDISFTYPGARFPVLNRFSLSIPKNSSVGIIGPTGSGKSTLVDLLLGLHEPSAGTMFADRTPLTNENIRAWQGGIGYVPQDVFLIDDTIARNIALGQADHEIDRDRLCEAAEAARILEFVEHELPNGFETTVGERGVRLSGGQRQRIAIARALYHRPSLLILDEATSALDQATEAAVTEAITSLQGRVTMVVVAHRLSTIERCNHVVDLAKPPPTRAAVA
jgi:ATP-binding cassette subfamily C protein